MGKSIGKLDFNKPLSKFVFGTQYYRPPTPPMNEWEEDFKRMQDQSFNTIKIWIQWCWVEPVNGKYKFEDFDRIFDLCEKYEMGIVPNIILECPPEWIYAKFPDVYIRDIKRNIKYEALYSAYQVGGFRPCWDHSEVSRLGLECLRRIVNRYKDRKCLVAWDVWNEPVQEFCACENTHNAFTTWLRKRFNNINSLNEFLGRKYSSFREVPIPYSEDNFPLMQLMYQFMHDRLAEQISWRSDIVREVDPKAIVMTHSVGPGSSIYRLDNDDWKNAKVVDFYGASMHQGINRFGNPKHKQTWTMFPLCLDATFSASPYYWVSELASGDQHNGFFPQIFSKEDVRFRTWTCLAHGVKGFLYWQFKPERLGPEAPGWGLVGLDGRELDRTIEAKEAAEFVKKWGDFLTEAVPVLDRVGILFDVNSFIMSDGAARVWRENPYVDAIRGAYQGLWYNHFAPRVVTPLDDWNEIDVLYLSFPILLTPEIAEKIKTYVMKGGMVVSEGGLGTYDYRTWHNTSIPGQGMEEVFSVKELEVLPAITPLRENIGVEFDKDYNLEFSYKISENLTGAINGALFKRIIKPIKADVIGKFKDGGEPALFRHKFGKGIAYYIATHPSVQVARNWDETSMLGIYNIIASVVKPRYSLKREGFVTARLLNRDKESLLFFFNHETTVQKIVFQMPDNKKISSIRGSAAVGSADCFHLQLAPRDVAIYHLFHKKI